MNYFVIIADILQPILVNTLQLFNDINALSKLKKKLTLSILLLLLLLIYAIPVDKGLFKAMTNNNLLKWLSYFEHTIFLKNPNTVTLSFLVFANLLVVIFAFKT